MKRMKQMIGLGLLLAAASVLVGCSSSPAAQETKSMKAGDGSQQPVATGATGAGGGGSSSATPK